MGNTTKVLGASKILESISSSSVTSFDIKLLFAMLLQSLSLLHFSSKTLESVCYSSTTSFNIKSLFAALLQSLSLLSL